MTSAAIDRELLDLEKGLWEAIKDKDGKAAARPTGDKSIVVGAQGIAEIDGETLARMIEGAPYELKQYSFDRDNLHIRLLTPDVAAVAYKVTEELVVEGAPVKLEAHDASVWVRRDGKWVCALHTESIAGDPYGRDRKPK